MDKASGSPACLPSLANDNAQRQAKSPATATGGPRQAGFLACGTVTAGKDAHPSISSAGASSCPPTNETIDHYCPAMGHCQQQHGTRFDRHRRLLASRSTIGRMLSLARKANAEIQCAGPLPLLINNAKGSASRLVLGVAKVQDAEMTASPLRSSLCPS
ncbi:hypothetical protein VTN77DRAFT_4816 [Rasamsonia byssochlamydoides]|uniref:uncharacterized protein n=1 Tax=Rasamsonia byssochlamydoides TaxID=89139 RepID=UPI0037420C74